MLACVAVLHAASPASAMDSSSDAPGTSALWLGWQYSSPTQGWIEHNAIETIDAGSGPSLAAGWDRGSLGALLAVDIMRYDVELSETHEYGVVLATLNLKWAPMHYLKSEWLSPYFLIGTGVRVESSRGWDPGPPEHLGVLGVAGLGVERELTAHLGAFAESRVVWDPGLDRAFLHIAAGGIVYF